MYDLRQIIKYVDLCSELMGITPLAMQNEIINPYNPVKGVFSSTLLQSDTLQFYDGYLIRYIDNCCKPCPDIIKISKNVIYQRYQSKRP